MRIGELVKQSGLAAHTIRFYESEGLIAEVSRTDNGYRDYGDEVLHCLERIQLGQRLGLSLQEIKVMGQHKDNWNSELMISQLDKKLVELRQLQVTLKNQEESILLIKAKLNSGGDRCALVSELSDILS